MKSRMKHRGMSSEPGFTLIEMVVAVLIVAVMIAVVAPHVLGAATRAQSVAGQEDSAMILDALDQYDLLYHTFPTGTTDQQLQQLVNVQLLDTVPQEPAGGSFVISDADPSNVTVTTVPGSGEVTP